LSTHGPRALCARGRKVSVYRNQQSGPDTLIAWKRTDAIFQVAVIRWINPDPQEIPGSYYARVKGATKHHHGATLKCQPARTNSIEIVAPHFQRIAIAGEHSSADQSSPRWWSARLSTP
jgi:hypothetical protein